jgi:hypothetical protein
LGENKRSIIDTVAKKIAVFEAPVLEQDVAMHCERFNLGHVSRSVMLLWDQNAWKDIQPKTE